MRSILTGAFGAMSKDFVNGFEIPSFDTWKKQVQADLKANDIDKFISSKSIEGVSINILEDSSKPISFKVDNLDVQEFPIESAKDAISINTVEEHTSGASIVQELAVGLARLHESLMADNTSKSIQMLYCTESQFFQNLAKFRALRFLIKRILKEYKIELPINLAATSSTRMLTIYDPFVNILRTSTAAMSAILGGANTVDSAPFNYLVTSAGYSTKDDELAKKIATNSIRILLEESNLGYVKDPASGSYAIENLTKEFITKSWDLFLTIEKNGGYSECRDQIQNDIKAINDKRLEQIDFRKRIKTGVTNYANTAESLSSLYGEKIKIENIINLRDAQRFEELRFQLEEKSKNLKINLLIYGDYSKLSGRINFCKNYFEILGIKVEEVMESQKCDVCIICASDNDLKSINEIYQTSKINAKLVFVAGKNHEYENPIYVGQNVYITLNKIVSEL